MTAVRYLCDEHISRSLAEALWNREPSIEIVYVGESDAPPFGSSDLELLQFAEREGFTFVSADRSTMPTHLIEHHAEGRETWGVFLIKRGSSWTQLIEDLLLIWSESTAEDWRNRLEYLPW